ncbi:22597_t:CDS:2, partial [Racocetra persica]
MKDGYLCHKYSVPLCKDLNTMRKKLNQMEQQHSIVDGLNDFGETTAKNVLAVVCGAIPIIGNVAANIAVDIIERTEKAQHNKKACKFIQNYIKSSLSTIAKFQLQGSIKESQEAYEKILKDIKL